MEVSCQSLQMLPRARESPSGEANLGGLMRSFCPTRSSCKETAHERAPQPGRSSQALRRSRRAGGGRRSASDGRPWRGASPRARARPGGDDLPYVYSGSLVARGHGRAEVTATGAHSEIGKIGLAIARIDTEPPRLRAQTRRLVRDFAAVSLSLSALAVVLYGLWRGGWLDALLSGIALGMSMLPEEFPLILTVFMVMGAWRISRARVLTRRVAAIETLGAATVLCTDKTGTLTQNRMAVAELRRAGEVLHLSETTRPTPSTAFRQLAEWGMLASAKEPYDPMEKAIHDLSNA